MYLPERFRPLPLKSLYFASMVAMVGILSLSFLVFHAISNRMQKTNIDPVFDQTDELQLESAIVALNSGGPKAVQGYMKSLNRIYGGTHFLLDSRGIDIVSGENRSALFPPSPITHSRTKMQDRWIVTRRSQDGKYWFAATGLGNRPQIWTYLPYYFLVFGATVALCWIAAAGVVSPIRRIAATIAQFGQGDLTVRITPKRQDEIGQLGRSFNQMAGRLERLIVNERRLLGDISHELRSPLARLKFAIKLARTSADSNAALDRIERDVNRITSLVADIVEITSIEDNPSLQILESVDIGNLIAEVAHDCALEAESRGCAIATSGAGDLRVNGNRELLRRAAENVLRNAIRYSPEHAEIQVSVIEESRIVVLSVRDHGPGVPESALARLFDPFFRVEEARDASGGGSGLGLSIAKRAVHLHHGTILAKNASPGLRVQISLPSAQNAELNAHEALTVAS